MGRNKNTAENTTVNGAAQEQKAAVTENERREAFRNVARRTVKKIRDAAERLAKTGGSKSYKIDVQDVECTLAQLDKIRQELAQALAPRNGKPTVAADDFFSVPADENAQDGDGENAQDGDEAV